MLAYLVKGITLGFAAGAQPGPFQTYLISQSLNNGWRRTLLAAFAPLLSDGPIVALVLLILTQIPAWVTRLLYIAGGLFVLYLAWGAFQQWRHFTPQTDLTDDAGNQSLWRAALMNALSPGPYLFWSMVNGPLIITAWNEYPGNALGFLSGFYAAMIGLNAAIILIFGLASRIGDRFRRTLLLISSIALAGFGIYQLWLGIFTS